MPRLLNWSLQIITFLLHSRNMDTQPLFGETKRGVSQCERYRDEPHNAILARFVCNLLLVWRMATQWVCTVCCVCVCVCACVCVCVYVWACLCLCACVCLRAVYVVCVFFFLCVCVNAVLAAERLHIRAIVRVLNARLVTSTVQGFKHRRCCRDHHHGFGKCIVQILHHPTRAAYCLLTSLFTFLFFKF